MNSNGHRAYLLTGSADIFVAGLGLVSSVLIARGLGPEGRGQLSAALLWPTMFGSAVSLGLTHAVAYAAGAKWGSTRSLARVGFRLGVSLGTVAGVAYAFAAPALLHEGFARLPISIRLYACFIPLSLWCGLWMAICQGRQDLRIWNIARMLRSAGYAAWIAGALALGFATVPVVLWSQVVIVILTLVLLAVRFRAEPQREPGEAPPIGRLLKYGASVYASGMVLALNQQLDQLLLSLWVPPQDLGQYASAASLSAIMLFLPGVAGPVLFARLAGQGARAARGHLAKVLAVCLAALAPMTLVMAVFAPQLVRLVYGDQFDPAGGLLRVLVPAAALLGMGNLLGDILRGSGAPFVPTYAALAGLIVTMPGLAIALPVWGITGAAWVSLIAYGTMLLVLGISTARVVLWPRSLAPGAG